MASIAAAVAKDEAVQKARAEPWHYLTHAYRDPHVAHARLNDLVKAQGWTGAAMRLSAEPEQLGRLRGRQGMFASQATQFERRQARWAVQTIQEKLAGVEVVQQRAGRGYRTSVAAQVKRDAIGIPKLSAATRAVLEAVHAARTEQSDDPWSPAAARNHVAVARAWESGRRDPAIAAEIDQFQDTAEQRLGGEGIKAALRSVRDGSPFSVPGVKPGQQRELNELARGLAAAHWGRANHKIQRAHEAFERSEQQGLRMRRRQGPSLGR